jgi:hypothetical protein
MTKWYRTLYAPEFLYYRKSSDKPRCSKFHLPTGVDGEGTQKPMHQKTIALLDLIDDR